MNEVVIKTFSTFLFFKISFGKVHVSLILLRHIFGGRILNLAQYISNIFNFERAISKFDLFNFANFGLKASWPIRIFFETVKNQIKFIG